MFHGSSLESDHKGKIRGGGGAANGGFLLVSASFQLAACFLALHNGKYVHLLEEPKLGKLEPHYGLGP